MKLLFRDEYIAAFDKPPGLLVHRSSIDYHEKDSAVQQARIVCGGNIFPAHRLDKPISGVLLFALNSECASQIASLLKTSQITKRYIAIVRGWTPEEGIIDHPLKPLSTKSIKSLRLCSKFNICFEYITSPIIYNKR